MKSLLSLLVLATAASVASADIHSPPAADQGPTRKLSRGLANLAFGAAEIPVTIGQVNEREGNAAALSHGVVRGVGRTLSRVRYGVQEVVLFPFPVYKGKYSKPYPSETIWIHKGMREFPPELGWESKRQYGRNER